MNVIISLGREMKKVALPICLLFFATGLFAQEYLDVCATPDSNETNTSYFSFSEDPVYLNEMEPTVVNIYFWRINDQFGNVHPDALTEQRALEAVQFLNINFNPVGIFFKYRGWESFDGPANIIWEQRNYNCGTCENYPFDPVDPCNNTTETVDPDGWAKLSRCQSDDMWLYANQNGYYKPNALNIYVPYATTDFGGAAASLGSNRMVTYASGLTGPVMLHEVGHCFGLAHSHNAWASTNSCEHVTRDPNDIEHYNANVAGDRVTDTAAQPDFAYEYCVLNGNLPDCAPNGPFRHYYYNIEDCEYEGHLEDPPRADCEGTPYVIDAVQSRNYMSYAPSECLDNFTIGQGIRMKEKIDNVTILAAIKDSIQSLYEPYKGEYYVVGPATQDPPLFQPGFNYRFVECDCENDCPEPSPYEDVSFSYTNNSLLTIQKEETDFSIITHPNGTAIQIDFINPLPDSYGQNVRKCYENYNKGAMNGTVTKFNDGVFNTNITVTPQDSTQINNPNLVNDLNPGLYKIEKNYENGMEKESIILKENNE